MTQLPSALAFVNSKSVLPINLIRQSHTGQQETPPSIDAVLEEKDVIFQPA